MTALYPTASIYLPEGEKNRRGNNKQCLSSQTVTGHRRVASGMIGTGLGEPPSSLLLVGEDGSDFGRSEDVMRSGGGPVVWIASMTGDCLDGFVSEIAVKVDVDVSAEGLDRGGRSGTGCSSDAVRKFQRASSG